MQRYSEIRHVAADGRIYLVVYTVRFEWDENKNRRNRVKHGMDFSLAKLVFDDPFAVSMPERSVQGEQRYQLIGAVFTRVVLVAHALRMSGTSEDDLIVRIISARKATPAERRLYEGNSVY